jgi:hypothetical protein
MMTGLAIMAALGRIHRKVAKTQRRSRVTGGGVFGKRLNAREARVQDLYCRLLARFFHEASRLCVFATLRFTSTVA